MRILALAILLIQPLNLPSQWRQTSGPAGGYPECFVVKGDTIFAGSFLGGVFRSTDNGAHWEPSSTGIQLSVEVRALGLHGSVLYAGTTGGIYKSTDAGSTWFQANSGLVNMEIIALLSSGGSVFAGGHNGVGVFKSTNEGVSWEVDTVGLPSSFSVTSFVESGGKIFAGTTSGVFRSTDNGATWTEANVGLTNLSVNTMAVINGSILAGTGGNGVFVSTDDGDSWSGGQLEITLGLAVLGSDVFKCGLAGISRSTDAGLTWISANTGIPPTNNTRSLCALGSTLFVGMGNNGERGGIYRSTDSGGNWTEANTGYINSLVYSFASDGTNIFSGTSDSGVLSSSDNGTTWTRLHDFGTAVFALYFKGSVIFDGEGSSTGNVHSSTNNGTTWNYSGTGMPTSGSVRAFATAGTDLLAARSSSGVYRSTNDGGNWTSSASGLTSTSVTSLLSDGTNVYAGTSGGVFVSASGSSWSARNTGYTSSVSAIVENASYLFASSPFFGVFRSPIGGGSWTAVNNGLSELHVHAMILSGSALIAGSNGGVFVSTDNGDSWTHMNEGLLNLTVLSLQVHSGYLFAGTSGNGAWRRPLSELTAVREVTDAAPAGFSLSENYPNPFNPSTRLKYSVAKSAFVSLKVYDVLGREVATLASGEFHPGTYEVSWDARNFPSGVYFSRFSAGSVTEIKCMVLAK